MKIQSRPFEYGHELEAEWPPRFGEGKGGIWHWDKKERCMKEGPAPREHEAYGQAPYFISDTLKTGYYHPAVQRYTESRSELNKFDQITGTITTDKKLDPDASWQKEQRRLRVEDGHKALHKSVAQIDAGTAPLSEETRSMCERQNEIVSSALGMDAFNVAGRKTNAKGKRFRRK